MKINYDFPVDDPDETRDLDTKTVEKPDAKGDGQEPEGGDDPPKDKQSDVSNRIAELERKLEKRQADIIDLLAKNTALQTRDKASEQEKKRWTPEQLKEFALKDNGAHQFDAAYHLVEQSKDEILNKVRDEYRQEKTQEFIRDYMSEIYPDLRNKDSEFTQAVVQEQRRLLETGVVNSSAPGAEDLAYNMALHRVGRANGDGESPQEHSRRRRLETSAAEGAPRRDPDVSKSRARTELSEGERRKMASMGLDPSNKETVARFKKLQAQYEKARTS